MVTPSTANGRLSLCVRILARSSIAALALFAATAAEAAPPKIRTDAGNTVPRCVTPKRLMAFIKTRNTNLDPRFADIASLYKKHGEAWRVRWDYAFFQMVVETNFLTYRRGNGGWGDVDPKQNNFAGLGTTGGGVPGDSYPNVSTGVLAQIQHLVVYSGERIAEPVGARTRLKQDDILAVMSSKKGNTTFSDLARRWAADRHYGASIEWVANNFRQNFCTGPDPVEEAAATPPKPQRRPANAKKELAQAANLGGPRPADIEAAAAAGPPVRTIWSAADAPDASSEAAQLKTTADAAPAIEATRTAPAPTRKPEAKTASVATDDPGLVVAEQMIQTGAEPVPAEVQVASLEPQLPAQAPVSPLVAPARDEPTPTAVTTAPDQQASRPVAFAFAAGLGAALSKTSPEVKAASACKIASASYGGKKVLLVRSAEPAPVRFTVLTVLEGFEKSMLDSYLKAHAPGGSSIGEFASRDAAFAKAKELCPGAAAAPRTEGASAG